MDKNFYMLLWGGLFFLFIGLWMVKRDREWMQIWNANMDEKENSLYELYESLEEIMNEMYYLYREGYNIEAGPPPAMDDGYDPVLADQDPQDHRDDTVHETQAETKKDTQDQNPEGHRYRLITDLSDQGLSVEEIARRLGIGKGEITLVLKFHKGRERIQ
ncbi:MAG TPA: hypothetical protein VFD89_05150 [Clostridia bacterium]|nr:hypothetical protein [Clostridia bacterium]